MTKNILVHAGNDNVLSQIKGNSLRSLQHCLILCDQMYIMHVGHLTSTAFPTLGNLT